MSCANSVLPVFMAASGQKPGRLPELEITVQIDTTLRRLEIRVSHGFQRLDRLFNRTAVLSCYYPFGLTLQRYASRIRHPHRNASSPSAHFYLYSFLGISLKVVPLEPDPFDLSATRWPVKSRPLPD